MADSRSGIGGDLLERCFDKDPEAWEEFLERTRGLILEVVGHTARMRSFPLDPVEMEELLELVFDRLAADEFELLRGYRGKAAFSTYLAVVVRRLVVNRMARRQAIATGKRSRGK